MKQPNFSKIEELFQHPETIERFVSILGSETESSAFIHTALRVVFVDSELKKCEPESVLNACLAVASLNLIIEPSFGHVYLSVHKENRRSYCQFQIGYKGLIDLCLRTEKYATINSDVVKPGEFKSIDRLTGELSFEWIQDNNERNKLNSVAYIAFFSLTAGFKKAMYLTKEEVEAHAKEYSKSFNKREGFWKNKFDAMAMKTLLKLLLDKFAPKTTELQRALKYDQAVIKDFEGEKLYYGDNPSTEETDEHRNTKEIEARVSHHIRTSKTVEKLEECYEDLTTDVLRNKYEAKLKRLKNAKKK